MPNDLVLEAVQAEHATLVASPPHAFTGSPSRLSPRRSLAVRSSPLLFELPAATVLPAPALRTMRPSRVAPLGLAHQPSLFPQPRVVVFDIETQRSFADVGGHDPKSLRRLMVSVAVCHDSATGTFRTFWERDIDQLVALLRDADLVVGFNILGFDYPVLGHYTKARLASLPTLDLMADVQRALGHRLPLDALVTATLGARKSASGLAAIAWWQQGELGKLESYCRDDVRLTHALYEFGRSRGYVLYTPREGGGPRRVRVHWR